jgi:hypothetical protein
MRGGPLWKKGYPSRSPPKPFRTSDIIRLRQASADDIATGHVGFAEADTWAHVWPLVGA